MSVERAVQQSAQDTLRWGDTLVQPFSGGADLSAGGQGTKQVVSARWRYPISWKLMCMATIQPPAGETATFNVRPLVVVGSGQGQMQIRLPPLVLAPPYGDVVAFFTIPAQDLQVRFLLEGVSDAVAGNQGNIQVGAYVAPITEPHAMTHLADGFMRDERFAQEARQGGWMQPAGFVEEPLGYRR